MRLIFEGHCDKQIAKRLGITTPTVRTYVQQIYARLGVSDRASLVIEIFRRQRSSDHQEEPRMDADKRG